MVDMVGLTVGLDLVVKGICFPLPGIELRSSNTWTDTSMTKLLCLRVKIVKEKYKVIGDIQEITVRAYGGVEAKFHAF